MLKVTIIGNLGADAQLKESDGKKTLMFQVASTEKMATGEKTIWVTCFKNWESGHDQHLTQGTKVYVRGRFSAGIFEKKDGGKDVSLTCNVDEIELLTAKK